MKDTLNAPAGEPKVRSSAWLECLAGKWEREGRQMIKLADAEPSVEGDMALRNAGAARHKCASELRAKMEKHSNDGLEQ